jgi:hypothetical protein
MAVTKQILNDGPRNHVVHLEIAGANAAANAVDVSALSGVPDNVSIVRIDWSLTGGDAQFLWDATANVEVFECPVGEGEQHFEEVGGLINNAGAGVTGDVLLTNPSGTANGSITIWCKKRSA